MSRYSRKREYDMRDDATALLLASLSAARAAAAGSSAAAAPNRLCVALGS
jgi:hypothetical protein